MRIAICTDIYLPQLSGVADSLEILMRELKRNGHAVRLYAPDIPGAKEDPDIVRLPAYMVPGSAGGLAIVLPFGAMDDLRRFAPDVIHTNTASSAGFFALYGSWRLHVPLIGTDHTFPADYLHYAKLDYAPMRYLVRKFSSWYYERCDAITAPSKSMLDELSAYGAQKPMQVISNHIPTDIFRPLPDKESLKNKYGINNNAILLFGRVATEKNLDYAFDIFCDVAKESDAELVIIGDGPYKAELLERIAKSEVAARVRYLGVLRGGDLVEAINACEVLLITSTSETQSMTTLQGLACELPAVAINAGGLPEYVHSGENGYVVEPKDKQGFCEKILLLINDDNLRKKLGEEGRKSVEQYSPHAITKKFENLYEKYIPQMKSTPH